MATIGSLTVDLQAEIAGFRRDLGRAQRDLNSATGRMNKSLDGLRRGFGRVERSVSGATNILRAFAGALAVRELGRFTTATLSTARALDDTARRLGLTTTALQELRFAAGEVGVATNTLDTALQRFTRRLGEAQAGTGELKGVIDQYNIVLTDSTGRARSAQAVLADYAEAVKGAGTRQEQLRLAFKAFDSEGAALVTLLAQGRDGMAELAGRANDLGLVLDDRTVRSMAATARELQTLNDVLRTNLRQGLMSGLATDAGQVRDVIADPQLREGFRAFGAVAGGAIRFVADEMARLGRLAAAVRDLDLGSAAEQLARGSVVGLVPGGQSLLTRIFGDRDTGEAAADLIAEIDAAAGDLSGTLGRLSDSQAESAKAAREAVSELRFENAQLDQLIRRAELGEAAFEELRLEIEAESAALDQNLSLSSELGQEYMALFKESRQLTTAVSDLERAWDDGRRDAEAFADGVERAAESASESLGRTLVDGVLGGWEEGLVSLKRLMSSTLRAVAERVVSEALTPAVEIPPDRRPPPAALASLGRAA